MKSNKSKNWSSYRMVLIAFSVFLSLVTRTVDAQTPGTQKWEFYGGGEFRSSPAIGSDGTVFIGTTTSANGVGTTKRFYAINPDGTEKWSFQSAPFGLPKGFETSPCIGPDGTVFVSVGTRMYLLRPEDGSVVRFFFLENESFHGPAVARDGNILVCAGSVFGLNLDDNTKSWGFSNGGGKFMMTPTVAPDGTIYVANAYSDGYRLTALTPDGKEKWFHFGQGVDNMAGCVIAIGGDGAIYFGNSFSLLTALNPDGTVKWTQQFNTVVQYRPRPVIGVNGNIYLKVHNGSPISFASLVCLDKNDGSILFSKSTIDDSFNSISPAITQLGVIYVPSGTEMSAMDARTGVTFWRYSTFRSRGFHGSCPAIGDGGTIYVGSLDNYLYAINGSGGGHGTLSGTSWPREGGDNRNSGQSFAPRFTAEARPFLGPALHITGWKGIFYQIERSTNLVDWEFVGIPTATGTVTDWIDSIAARNLNPLFYRVVIRY